FQAAPAYPAGTSPQDLAVGDFNTDGHPDMAVANDYYGSNGTVSVLLGSAGGGFQPAVSYAAGGSPRGLAVGDFDGNGVSDLVVTNFIGSNGKVSVLLGKGDGTFQPAKSYAAGPSPISVVVADFTGDGVLDLAVTNYNYVGPGIVSILRGTGTGRFLAPVSYAAGVAPWFLAAGDFDGDGDQDLAVTNAVSAGTVSVLLNNGNGSFQAPVSYSAGTNSWGVTAADFDGDGALDLAVTNWAP